eukprot:scaffold345_cov134-Cylindrotheca_fusiformis.AAC.19
MAKSNVNVQPNMKKCFSLSLLLLAFLSHSALQLHAEELEDEEDFPSKEDEDVVADDDLPFQADMYAVEQNDIEKGSEDSEDSVDWDEYDHDLYSDELNGNDLEEEEDWFLAEDAIQQPRCRDDAYIDCKEVSKAGDCSMSRTGILATSKRNLCPVTCGMCQVEENDVWLEHDCFTYSQDIHVFFHNEEPEKYDFVGIYPASFDLRGQPELLLKPHMWLTTCGGLHEYCKAAKGGLLFGNVGPSDETTWKYFPLVPGEYKAALSRGDDPHELIVESTIFTAKPEGHGCDDGCQDLVSTDKDCYTQVETIRVTFENCSPHEEDLIAIYKYYERPGDEEPLMWLGACGSQDCRGLVSYDILLFGPRPPNEAARTTWPLPPGDYTAHLIKFNAGANHAEPVAQTAFNVREQCLNTANLYPS